jgi:DnaJ like chaperone protein
MFGTGHESLLDLMEGLFHIALADGNFHPHEDTFLAEVGRIFGIDERQFRTLTARFVPGVMPDPYDVLGVDHDTPTEEIRAAWRRLVRDTHPDRMAARGLPPEAVRLAEKRLVCINHAWDEIRRLRGDG